MKLQADYNMGSVVTAGSALHRHYVHTTTCMSLLESSVGQEELVEEQHADVAGIPEEGKGMATGLSATACYAAISRADLFILPSGDYNRRNHASR
jgi:hypothetical protein